MESSCGHRQRLQSSLPGDMNIKEGSCCELSRVSLLGAKLQRETDVLRMGLCHSSCVSQLSFATLIYKRRKVNPHLCIVYRKVSKPPFRGQLPPDASLILIQRFSLWTGGGATRRNKAVKREESCLFFSNTFPFIGMVRLMRIAHKKNEIHKKVVQ